MEASDKDNISCHSEVFNELLDIIIVDVASECHRIARLGLDRNLDEVEEEVRLSVEARAKVAEGNNNGETNGKYVSDIFGQTHPAIANEIFNCMNCGRSIMAGRFAPHLEKCMGKGRNARVKATRSRTAAAQRNHGSSNAPYTRLSNGRPSVSDNDHSNGTTEAS